MRTLDEFQFPLAVPIICHVNVAGGYVASSQTNSFGERRCAAANVAQAQIMMLAHDSGSLRGLSQRVQMHRLSMMPASIIQMQCEVSAKTNLVLIFRIAALEPQKSFSPFNFTRHQLASGVPQNSRGSTSLGRMRECHVNERWLQVRTCPQIPRTNLSQLASNFETTETPSSM